MSAAAAEVMPVAVTLACKAYPPALVHVGHATHGEDCWSGRDEREVWGWWPTEHYHALSASAGGESKPS